MNREYLEVWNSLMTLINGVRKEIENAILPTDISYLEFQILQYVKFIGPSTLATLSKELTITRAGVTFTVEGLESRGLVKRKKVEEGRRVVFIALTPLGGRRLNVALKLQNDLIIRKMSQMNGGQLKSLNTLMLMLNALR